MASNYDIESESDSGSEGSIEECFSNLSLEDEIREYPMDLTWNKFLSEYCKHHKITRAQGMATASEAWKEYKRQNNIVPASKKAAQQKLVEPTVIKRNTLKTTATGRKSKVTKVNAPPKGKKVVVNYVTDSEGESSEEEEEYEEVEVVKKIRRPVRKAQKEQEVKQEVPKKAKQAPKVKPPPEPEEAPVMGKVKRSRKKE